ncbi:MAG: hypothetical protein SOY64_08490, partial [Pyramidobacter sp.]|uniref:hypothetical protein n=1 Tax=Pyramidobacter sp. TaxID=1943581 RepID=UPI002A7FCBE6
MKYRFSRASKTKTPIGLRRLRTTQQPFPPSDRLSSSLSELSERDFLKKALFMHDLMVRRGRRYLRGARHKYFGLSPPKNTC